MKIVKSEIPADRIDLTDRQFRITIAKDPAPLIGQIEAVGLLQLPYLVAHGNSYRVICGFRRIEALMAIGQSVIPANLIANGSDTLGLAKIAVIDNTSQRTLNLVEQANACTLIKKHAPAPGAYEDHLIQVGLPVNKAFLAQLNVLFRASQTIKEAVNQGDLTLPMACQLAKLEHPEGLLFTKLFLNLGVGLSKQRELVELCQEICAREDITLQDLFENPTLQQILENADGDRGQNTRVLREVLKKRRYPGLESALNQFHRLTSSFKMPPHISLDAPGYLEGSQFKLTFRFDSTVKFKESVEVLSHIANSEALKRIVQKDFDSHA